jgi:hypothetical protein
MTPRRPHALAALALAVLSMPLFAWGPHSEITQAGADALPADAALLRCLGADSKKLRDYCWMGDMRRSLKREPETWFYADDYLLFPGMTTHLDHLCPEVKGTYVPYFRRALQAMRTESPVNAARWIGAILHFTEDTGSPPHAAEIRGEVHSKMENWVDARAIHINGYQPQLLGHTDEEALAGFLQRMDGLIEFSKLRAERAKPFVLSGDRAATEPIVLESALETSRVVADLLFTLGELSTHVPAEGAALQGTIASSPAPEMEKLPAKVLLLGTPYATLADGAGHYEFRHLPPGTFRVSVLRAGSATAISQVTLARAGSSTLDFTLPGDAGNLLRNGSFGLHWIAPAQSDAWYPVKHRLGEAFWEGELIPVVAGRHYKLQVDWQPQAQGQVVAQLLSKQGFAKPATALKTLLPGETEFVFSPAADAGYAQVLIYSKGVPGGLCKSVVLAQMP